MPRVCTEVRLPPKLKKNVFRSYTAFAQIKKESLNQNKSQNILPNHDV